MGDKEVIEAALFAAGGTLELGQLSRLIGRDAQDIVRSLAEEYRARETAIEILEIGDRFVMQVKPEYAEQVRLVAPRELSQPVLRTLSIIAYRQPITQSEVVAARGNSAYTHVKELEVKGLIEVVPKGRTKQLQTGRGFADYFGLDSSDPESIKQKIMELAKKQPGLERWLEKERIGVSPMYESLMGLCGIADYSVVRPYEDNEATRAELSGISVLVAAKGYADRIRKYYEGKLIEVSATTFDELIDTIRMLSGYGQREAVERSVAELESLKERYRSRALGIDVKVKPATEMAAKLLADLRLNISSGGSVVAPDYGTSGRGDEIKGDVLIPTHGSGDADIVKRVCSRYDALIEGLLRIGA